jgi:hypothetical protein
MMYASNGITRPADVDDATAVIGADGHGPDSRWSLAGTRPTRLASRLAAAALGVGVVGGMLIACLSVLFGATDVSPAARVLAIAVPVVLVVLIGWRLAAVTGLVRSSPSGRLLAWVAVAGVVLTAVVQGGPEVGALGDDIAHNAGVALAVLFYGAAFGMAAAVAGIVLGVPVLLLLRASRVWIPLPTAQVLLTAFAMAVTAVFALWVTRDLHTEIVTGMAVALAGVGAVLTARWCLVDRQA